MTKKVKKKQNTTKQNEQKKPDLTIYKPRYIGVVGRILKKCREVNKQEPCVYGMYLNYKPFQYEQNIINKKITENDENTIVYLEEDMGQETDNLV